MRLDLGMNMVVAEVVFSELKHEKLKNDTMVLYLMLLSWGWERLLLFTYWTCHLVLIPK